MCVLLLQGRYPALTIGWCAWQREDAKKARDAVKAAGSGRSVEDRIRELEMRQQTETLSLAEEKRILRELGELHDARRIMLAATESKDAGSAAASAVAAAAAGSKDQWAVLSERITAKQAERTAIRERIDAQAKILNELKAKRDALSASTADREKQQALSAEYLELRAEYKKVNDDFYQCVRCVCVCVVP